MHVLAVALVAQVSLFGPPEPLGGTLPASCGKSTRSVFVGISEQAGPENVHVVRDALVRALAARCIRAVGLEPPSNWDGAFARSQMLPGVGIYGRVKIDDLSARDAAPRPGLRPFAVSGSLYGLNGETPLGRHTFHETFLGLNVENALGSSHSRTKLEKAVAPLVDAVDKPSAPAAAGGPGAASVPAR